MDKQQRILMLLMSNNRFFDWLRSNDYFGWIEREDDPPKEELQSWLHRYITTASDWAGYQIAGHVYFCVEREIGIGLSGNDACGIAVPQSKIEHVIKSLTVADLIKIPVYQLDVKAIETQVALYGLMGVR